MSEVARYIFLVLTGIAATLFASQALADAANDPDRSVAVNPGAASGTQLLLYPGGTFGRLVPPLLEPGARNSNRAVRLHMPRPHPRVARVRQPSTAVANANAPAANDTTPYLPETALQPAPQTVARQTPKPAAKLPPKPAPKVASNKPNNSPGTVTGTFTNVTGPNMSGPTHNASNDSELGGIPLSFGAMPPRRSSLGLSPFGPARNGQAPPQRMASNAPQNSQTLPNAATAAATSTTNSAGLSKHGQVKFRPGATEVVPAAINGIRLLASDLNSALDAGAQRVQLDAFGGRPGDKSSEARRLALRRALGIRQLLIEAGVPASRIDVRAMGGITDHGAPDRVDVFVRA